MDTTADWALAISARNRASGGVRARCSVSFQSGVKTIVEIRNSLVLAGGFNGP